MYENVFDAFPRKIKIYLIVLRGAYNLLIGELMLPKLIEICKFT